MGQNHARIYHGMAQADFVGVFDSDEQTAQRVARSYNCRAFGSIDELLDAVDGVSIVSPTIHHAEHGITALQRGVHVLIEKPMATREKDCLQLIDEAQVANKVLHVGHIERFNPVVGQLKSILHDSTHKIHGLSSRRMSSLSSRIMDVDVVMDLMIHDIDIALYLRDGQEIVKVDAYGVGGDHVIALVAFDDGGIASFTASRITQKKIRELQISSDWGFFEVDYLDQKLHRHSQLSDPRSLGETGSGTYVLDESIERILVRPAEPLVLELDSFIAAMQGKESNGVSGMDAMKALQIGWRIQERLNHAS